MSKVSLPEVDLDWSGDALDLCIAAGPVVAFRRHGDFIVFGLTPGTVVRLTADEAETIATNLYAASQAARQAKPHVVTKEAT